MDAHQLAKWWAAIAGISLVGAGLLAFVDNPIVGEPPNTIFHTGLVHDIVHIATGLVALFIAFGLVGVMRANALIAFGALYGVVLIVTLLSPDLFGIFAHPVNLADHVLHVGLAVVSIGVGWWARSAATT